MDIWKNIRDTYNNLGIELDIYGDEKLAHLSLIRVPKELRNKGYATKAMNNIIKIADKFGTTITLSPTSEFGSSKQMLIAFYKKFGFVSNSGSNKDYRISDTMYRLPDKFIESAKLFEYIVNIPNHKNSKGEVAPWVIKSHTTGKILSSHTSKADAEKHLQQMHIYKESAKTDKEYLGIAVKLYNDVMTFISKLNSSNYSEFAEYEENGYYETLPGLKGYAFYLDRIGSINTGLILILTPYSEDAKKNNPGMGTLKDSGTPYIRYPCMVGDYNLKSAENRILRHVLVHEFIHVLDKMRYKKPEEMKPSSRFIDFEKDEDKDFPSYFNDPIEYNAFFMETADKIRKYVKILNPENRNKLMETPYTFIQGVLKYFDSYFIKYMTNKTGRKVIKRLFSLYDDIKNDSELMGIDNLGEANKKIKNLLLFS